MLGGVRWTDVVQVISRQILPKRPSSFLAQRRTAARVWGSLLLPCAPRRDPVPKPAPAEPGHGIFGIVDLELAPLNKVQIATMWVSSPLASSFWVGERILAKQMIVDCCDRVDVS